MHSRYMARSLDLARLGLGRVAPNPLVGSVIVNNGKIIGEGYHKAHGGPHAEVNAINSVEDPGLLPSSTLYVNLEPCNHQGLTPACTNLILEKSIPKVVIGQKDPNPLVSGKGIKHLKEKGVEIELGVLEDESRKLNRRFNIFQEKQRPFIMLKWAQTIDGFVDIDRKIGEKVKPKWITDEYCRMLVHKWRSEEAAIMVGTETAIKDNPQLNVRSWSGKNPLRIVIDQFQRLPQGLKLFDGSIPTLVYTAKACQNKPNLEYVKISFENNFLDTILKDLYGRSVQSLIVEGGPILLNSFIEKDLWDEARVFTGPGKFEQGVPAPKFNFLPDKHLTTGNSKLEIYRNNP